MTACPPISILDFIQVLHDNYTQSSQWKVDWQAKCGWNTPLRGTCYHWELFSLWKLCLWQVKTRGMHAKQSLHVYEVLLISRERSKCTGMCLGIVSIGQYQRGHYYTLRWHIFTGRFVCDFTVQLILLVLNSANSCQVVLFITLARGFNEIHNYLRVLIFAILLSFAEIAEINTRENMSP